MYSTKEGRAALHYAAPRGHPSSRPRSRFGLSHPDSLAQIANGVTESEGNGAGFYGKPYQPGAVVKNDVEYILFLRKGRGYRSVSPIQKALSMLTKAEMQSWVLSFWTDIKGASTRSGFPGQQC